MSADPVDVIIVTVIQPELLAALAALGIRDANREQDNAGTLYYRGTVRSALSGRELWVAVTCVGSAGNPDAAAAVRDAIAWGHPRAVMLTGIAAGMRGQVRLGEVVLAERVVSYEPAALITGSAGSHVELRPEIEKLPHEMNQHVVSYRPEPQRLARFLSHIGGGFPEAPAGADSELPSKVEIHRATIASGEKLLRDPAKMQEIRALHGKIAAIDMESVGVVAACRRSGVPWLVIRGISDFGDAHKDDRFHDLAACAAAVVLADFLAYGLDLAPRSPSPRPRLALSPRYPDGRTHDLSEQVEDALRRRQALEEAGAKTTEVDQEIVQIKRQLREGGQLRAGDALGDGRYLLVEPLGRGGFASVWKALDRTQRGIVALKVLHPDLAGDSVRRDRFFRGARIMAELDHPAVARVLEPCAEDGGFYYFVIELVQGGDLRRAILEGRLSKDRVLPLLLRIGEALVHAHDKGIVHRDVKPANVLLDESGQPKLTDFDLVVVGDTTGGTRTGTLGTILYAAPECLHRPQEADARADVYGLGMTAVFCLHGAELPVDVIRDSDEIIDALDCDERIGRLLRQATAWKREQRLATAEAFCEALRDALRSTVTGGEPMVKFGTDILSWVTDGRNNETVWMTQDGDGVRVVARVPALILAADEQIWVVKRGRKKIRLLAPEALDIMWSRPETRDEQQGDLPTIDAEVDDVLLVHAASGRTISLNAPEVDRHAVEYASAFELNSSIEVLSSLGPYVFIRTSTYSFLGGAHGFHGVTFRTIDLRSGSDVDLLTPGNHARLTSQEGNIASNQLCEIVEDFPGADGAPELTLFLLSYRAHEGDTLHVEYQFTAPCSYTGSDNLWNSYSRSVLIGSETVPAALEAYSKGPRVLSRYWEKAPRFGTAPRWTAAHRSPRVRTLLRRLFDGEGTP